MCVCVNVLFFKVPFNCYQTFFKIDFFSFSFCDWFGKLQRKQIKMREGEIERIGVRVVHCNYVVLVNYLREERKMKDAPILF